MRTSGRIVGSALVVLLLGTGCGGTADTSTDQTTADPTTAAAAGAAAGDQVVELVDFEIIASSGASPGTFSVVNEGNAPHTLTADDGSFDTGTLQPGEETTVTIEATGPVAVRCEIHPEQMRGTIDLG